MPGPPPKRSDHRRRRNKEGGEVEKLNVKNPEVDAPAAREGWHPLIADWYQSLIDSAQARYFEPSDWAHAQLIAYLFSNALIEKEQEDRKLPAMMIQTLFSEMSKLMTTEGERRRLRLEVERGNDGVDPDHAEVTSIMANYGRNLK